MHCFYGVFRAFHPRISTFYVWAGTIMNQSPVPFARRALKRVAEVQSGEDEFTVVTYNILADYSIEMGSKEKGTEVYSYCPRDCKMRTQGSNPHRHSLLLEELRWLNGDIICLQEVDTPYFKEVLADEMSRMGYQGMFAPRCMPGDPEGVAMFFKRDKFELEETKTFLINELSDRTFKPGEFPKCFEVVLLAALRHKISDNLLVIGTTHIRWGKLLETVTQVCEITFVTNALAEMVKSFESRGYHVSHILCGDFNIEPHFPAYQFLTKGKLSDKEMRELESVDYITWSPDVEPPSQLLPDQVSLLNKTKMFLHHPLKNLLSAYKTVLGAEPECTNHEGPGCVWTLDYIWFDSAHLKATAALETVSKAAIAPHTGLPNKFFPSDHLSLKAHFKFATS